MILDVHLLATQFLSSSPLGFNGGLPQTFQVRFNTLDAKQYQYIDVDPPNSTYFVVEHLNPETKYEFTVRGRNALGDGPYYLGVVLGKTKGRK